MRRFKGSIFIVLALALMFSSAAAQVPTGKIVGKVTDNQGVPLPGVAVTADSPRLVGQANAVTDATGVYRIFSLPAGTYSIRFTLPGFRPLTRRDIIVQLEQTIALNVSLEQSTIAEDITVIGQSPLIDVKSTTKGSTMTRDVFMQLPHNRSFDGLLTTVPGVTKEYGYGDVQVDGASGGENVFYIDGTNTTHVHRGYSAQSIVMEQLEEVKVTASGYTAEFGGSMGGVINVISRSGANEFHGDMFGYYDNNRLWMQGKNRQYLRLNPYAYPYVAEYVSNDDLYYEGGNKRDDTQRFEGVFNLSGYIVKDMLWFFGSFNPIYNSSYADRWFRSDPVNLAQAKIPGDAALDPRQGRQTYPFYRKDWNWNWQAKLTAAPIRGMRISLSAVNNFSHYSGQIPGITGTASKNYPYVKDWPNTIKTGIEPGFDYPNWSGNTTIDYTVSNNFLVSLRGGFFHQNQNNQQVRMPGTYYYFNRSNMTLFPEIPDNLKHDAGWTNWSGPQAETKKYILERLSGNLDLSYYVNLAGEHAIKAGMQYIQLAEDVDSTVTYPMVNIYWGTYTDRPDGRRVQGKYGYYTTRGDFVSPYGSFWNIHSNNWAIYLQDSWTIGQKFTFNLGLRTESEYIPAFDVDPKYKNYKPIQFGFGKKMAPRLGAIYDVFGDSSLKVFASFGIYYDVMKLYMAEGAYGGFLWWTSYYALDDYDWTKIAATNDIKDKASIIAGNRYFDSGNDRTTSWDTTEPNLKPVSQSEFSFGAEKKLSEELSFSARFVYKHLIRTIEDVGVMMKDAQGNYSEQYYIANPGEGWTLPVSKGGRFADDLWQCPKPKREYFGLNLTLEKRFSNNWQGGINYTWSSLRGNYGGLYSSDETGRRGPNVDRYWDLYFERYDIHGKPLDGPLPTDRPHYIRAYGSYAFPFGLTVGVTAYGRSGFPHQTNIWFNRISPYYPEGYGDKGRLPFAAWADVYLEYNLRIAKKYTINLNTTISNITNTSAIVGYADNPAINQIVWSDYDLTHQTLNWRNEIATHEPDPRYGMWSSRMGPWSWRMGARLSF